MTDKKDKEKDKEESEEKKSSHSLNTALIGGALGLGVGLFSDPEFRKQTMESMKESEMLRVAGKELKRSAQELITEQAVSSIKQAAMEYKHKYEQSLLPSPGSDKSDEKKSSKKEDSDDDSFKEDLNERLNKIEEALSKLIDSGD